MAEQTEAVRAEKTSDQLEVLDVKKYPSLYGRLFIESVTGSDMMDPDLAPPHLRFLATPHDIDNRSYNHIFEGLSIEERKEQWKGIGFNDAYVQWREKFTDFMKGIKDQKRIEALRVIAGKEPSEFTVKDADELFADFSRDKTDVTSFAKHVVANLVKEGKVDPANLKALLPHIEWIASGIFGEKTAGIVNRVIEIEAQLQNNAKEFGIYLHNASPGKPELMSEERSILATLHSFRKGEKKQDQQQLDQQPPVQPKDDKDQTVSEAIPDLDATRLKAIYERCVAKYEGQNPNGLLDINVRLDEVDRAQVRKLIDIAKSTHAKFTDGNSDWTKFVKLREEMRAIHGTFMENTRFIEDNSIQTPTKGTKDNIPVIKIPANIFRHSVWESKISSLDRLFDQYDKGNSKGTGAEYLGNHINEVYKFVEASQSSDKKDIPPEEAKQESHEKSSDEKPPTPTVELTEEAKWLISHFDRRGHLEITAEGFDQMLQEHGFSDEDIKGKSGPELIDMLRTKGKAPISPPAPATDGKKVDQKLAGDEKPPAPPATETESADKKPGTSQEKQEATIKVVMTENDKGEAQFKLTANGKEIPINAAFLWLNSVDEYDYLEVPSGITADFLIPLTDKVPDLIIVVGGQGVKLNLETLKTLEALNILSFPFIHLGSTKSESRLRDEDLSKLEGQVLRIIRKDGDFLETSREWIAFKDLEKYLEALKTTNPTPDNKTDKSPKKREELENFQIEMVGDKETESIQGKVEIHGDDFMGKLLTPEILKEEGLLPKHKVRIGDSVVWLSSSGYELDDEGRIAVVAYVEKQGKVTARSYYRSNSQGVWRYLPNYRTTENGEIEWFGKGHSEESITLPIVMQKALSEITREGVPVLELKKNPNFIFAGTARKVGKGIGTYHREVETTPKRLEGTFYTGHGKTPPEQIRLSEEQSPDFTKLLTSWEQKTSVYGQINVEVFPSKDGALKFMFCKDVAGRVWIGGIEDDSEIQSTGLKKSWIEGGDLATPAFEYKTAEVDEAGGYGNDKMRNGYYVDMYKNYLKKIPVIQEYLKASVARRAKGRTGFNLRNFWRFKK